MDTNPGLRDKIHKVEQDILQENENYQRAAENKDNEDIRLDSLHRILVLQKKLQELKARIKS